MVVIYMRGSNLIEAQFEMIDKPPRMRADNAVRRWELLQLEDETEHMFKNMVEELVEVTGMKLTPEGVKEMAREYGLDKNDTTNVEIALHHKYGDKLKNLTLYKYLESNTRFLLSHLSAELTVLTENMPNAKDSVRLRVQMYVTRYH